MKKVRKLASLFLGLVISVNVLMHNPVVTIVAKSAEKTYDDTVLKKTENGKLSNAITEYGIKDADNLIRRNDKEKDLNSMVYENIDGSETLYIFKEAVKYVDDKGNIKDKSNTLSNKFAKTKYVDKYAYVNDQNDINTYFPKWLSENSGVVLEYDNFSIEMYPENTESSITKIDDKKVIYNNVFGSNAVLEYEATFDGYKENVVIFDDSINTFTFIVELDGLYIEKNIGAINFISNCNGEMIANMSPIYVYDSYKGEVSDNEAHYSYANELNYKKIQDGKYEIIIEVDKEFLSDPNTQYPVYIDPSATVVAGYEGIIDTPIYNGPDGKIAQSGANVTGVIGYVNSSYGTGRMLMAFPGLMEYPFMISGDYTITSAKLNLYDESGLSTEAIIGAYEYTGPEWNESSVYSSSIWNGLGALEASAAFSYPNKIGRQLDISAIVGEWHQHTTFTSNSGYANPEKGIILRNITNESSAAVHKCIKTSENNTKPYLSLRYVYNGCKGGRFAGALSGKNCMEYAFFVGANEGWNITEAEKLEYAQLSVANALAITKSKVEIWLNDTFGSSRWREVATYDVEIAEDEWIVCMRVGVGLINGVNKYDYHFWYRSTSGRWHNKHGQSDSENLTDYNINPSTANSSSGWAYADTIEFYNSDTIYYVMKSINGGSTKDEA